MTINEYCFDNADFKELNKSFEKFKQKGTGIRAAEKWEEFKQKKQEFKEYCESIGMTEATAKKFDEVESEWSWQKVEESLTAEFADPAQREEMREMMECMYGRKERKPGRQQRVQETCDNIMDGGIEFNKPS